MIGTLIWSLLSGYDVKWWRVIKQWALCLFKVMLNWKHNWLNRIWHGRQLLLQWMSEAASDSWQLWVTARNVAACVSSYTGNVFSWTAVSCGFVWLKAGERNGDGTKQLDQYFFTWLAHFNCRERKKAQSIFTAALKRLNVVKIVWETNRNKTAHFWFCCN